MATNGPKGKGRTGAVKSRVQVVNPRILRHVKINTLTNKIMDVKADSKPFKGVRKHK